MSEIHISRLIGSIDRPQPVMDAETAPVQEQEKPNASENSDQDSTAEGDRTESEAQTEGAASEETTGEVEEREESAGDKDGDQSWKQKYDLTERDRRDWQRKANQSDHDLGQALQLLERVTQGVQKGTIATGDGGQDGEQSAVHSLLDGMEPGSLVKKEDLQSFAGKLLSAVNADKKAEQRNKFKEQAEQSVKAQSDYQQVVDYANEHDLTNLPGWEYTNEVGRYHAVRSHMLGNQIKETQERLKRTKTGEGAKGGLKNAPPMTSGRTAGVPLSARAKQDTTGVLAALQNRRKARGIRGDGSFAPPK